MRFLTDFGSQLGSEMIPWSTIFDKKVIFSDECFGPGTSPEPTWARFGAENAPRTYFDRFGVDFWLILERFGITFGRMFNDFPHILLMCFARTHAFSKFFFVQKPSSHKHKKQKTQQTPKNIVFVDFEKMLDISWINVRINFTIVVQSGPFLYKSNTALSPPP